MKLTRRGLLRLSGVSAVAVTPGCLDEARQSSPGTATPTPPTDDGSPADDTPTDDGSPADDTPTDDGPPADDTPTDDGSPADDTPTDGEPADSGLPSGLERVDEPPYEISPVECYSSETDTSDSGRDPLYLCANMPTEPSLSFTQASTTGSVLDDGGLRDAGGSGDQLYATLLTDDADRERVSDRATGRATELIRGTDFQTQAVLVVETGWGSGSVTPHIERVESTQTGVHAFGCHTQPCAMTMDYTARTTAVRFERPDSLSTGVVSLTVDPDERWNVAAGEGVVSIPAE